MRILIANRGEIARRIMRTVHRLGHESVAVYADPDEGAPFVGEAGTSTRIGPADLAHSYLSIESLMAAAGRCGADAVHPGYGFLSENADFARAVTDEGLIWIGPHAEAIERMGSKIEARRLADAAGVPIIPGFDRSQDLAELAAAAERIGYPVLVKAAAGGGGKGIRIVDSAGDLEGRLADARRESSLAFGDDQMIVERYVQRPRHVEVQVVGDRHGSVIELGTRECSVQRRYQKVLEEAPAPNLPDETRAGLRSSAAELARSIGYDSAGTVEFIVDDETGEHFFLEMNTRLQVEHPVTEAVTGLDLVELMIRSATGEPLPVEQSQVEISGHALEARINAEDPSDFTPQIGTVTHLRLPDGVRWESGVELGSEISPHYDSMVAKLVVHATDRATALRRARAALADLVIGGLVTNTGFHHWLLDQAPVVDGRVTTRFLDEIDLPGRPDLAAGAAAAAHAWCVARDSTRSTGPWGSLVGFRVTPHRGARTIALADAAGERHELSIETTEATGDESASAVDLSNRSVAVTIAGHTHTYRVLTRSERWAPSAGTGHGHAGAVTAPFPALVTEVKVEPGAVVAGGDVVVVIEAMKMLHSLTAAGPGVVDEVRVVEGDQIVSDQVLVTFRMPSEDVTEPGGGP